MALIGQSPLITALRAEIGVAARTQVKVLITGETGVEKEVVARLIRRNPAGRPVCCAGLSRSPGHPLGVRVIWPCARQLPEADPDKVGLVRLAAGGTLLDELGDISARMQTILVRFIETGVGVQQSHTRSDVRLLTATQPDLPARIASGDFREDLYYRLNVVQLHIPPLRERGDDVRLLVHQCLAQAAALNQQPVPTLTPAAEARLIAYRWPGNLSELQRVAERLVLSRSRRPLTVDDLPGGLAGNRSVSRSWLPTSPTPGWPGELAPTTYADERHGIRYPFGRGIG